MKCRYSHCLHETKDIAEGEEVLVGKGTYYHKDCYELKESIKAIIDYYVENFDKDPIYAQLTKTINNIVFHKNKTPAFVLYALHYAKWAHIPLRHPAGIYYLIKDDKIITAWKSTVAKKKAAEEVKRLNETEIGGYKQDESGQYDFVKKPIGFGRALSGSV